MSERMETRLHAALDRSPMPIGPLSDMVKWMHARIKAHQESTRRWRERNPELARLCASNRYFRTKTKRTGINSTLSLEERRRIKAEYMKAWRASERSRKKAIVAKVRREDWDRWKKLDDLAKEEKRLKRHRYYQRKGRKRWRS